MLTNQVGGISETAVELALLRNGYNVMRPTIPDRYDLAVRVSPKTTMYVQVKSGSITSSGDIFVSCGHKPYSPSEVDVIAVHCQPLDTVYYVPIEKVRPGARGFNMRLSKRKYRRVNGAALSADDYTTFPFGGHI